MSADDNVAINGKYSRLNEGGLTVTGVAGTVTITDYFASEADIKVNGAVIADDTPLDVTLTDGYEYKATRFAETISGTGTVSGADEDDTILVGSENVTFTRFHAHLDPDYPELWAETSRWDNIYSHDRTWS